MDSRWIRQYQCHYAHHGDLYAGRRYSDKYADGNSHSDAAVTDQHEYTDRHAGSDQYEHADRNGYCYIAGSNQYQHTHRHGDSDREGGGART